ncbi:MAG: hypothetical protein JRF64_06455 [Deltaproteobacteria bacterium]|nr:hypothetical protein [Deltaproteobacteria bacterium]
MKERRKLERFSFEVPAKLEVAVSGEGNRVFDLPTSDICAGGAFFLDRLKELISHNRINVKVKGTVVRCGSAGMAICFEEDYQIVPLHAPSQ